MRSTKTWKATRKKRRQKTLRKSWTWWVLLTKLPFHLAGQGLKSQCRTSLTHTLHCKSWHREGFASSRSSSVPGKSCAGLLSIREEWFWSKYTTYGTEACLPKEELFPRWSNCHQYFLWTATCVVSQETEGKVGAQHFAPEISGRSKGTPQL